MEIDDVSKDDVEPRQPPSLLTLNKSSELTTAETLRLFADAHDKLVEEFARWDQRVANKDGMTMDDEEFLVYFKPSVTKVIWGQKPDYSGAWRGYLILSKCENVQKLRVGNGEERIYGFRIGSILDFWCYNALLYFGSDGKVYFVSEQYLDEWMENGWRVVHVMGGYDLRHDFVPERILNP